MSRDLLQRRSVPANRPSAFGRSLFPGGVFDELFDRAFGEGRPAQQWSEMMRAAMDVAETDNAFEVTLDLPGVKADDVDIQVDKNTLVIRGHREDASDNQESEDRQFHRVERFTGSFARSIVLPGAINEDEAAAEFKDGVLKVVIPKADQARPRRISITG